MDRHLGVGKKYKIIEHWILWPLKKVKVRSIKCYLLFASMTKRSNLNDVTRSMWYKSHQLPWVRYASRYIDSKHRAISLGNTVLTALDHDSFEPSDWVLIFSSNQGTTNERGVILFIVWGPEVQYISLCLFILCPNKQTRRRSQRCSDEQTKQSVFKERDTGKIKPITLPWKKYSFLNKMKKVSSVANIIKLFLDEI